MDSSLDIGHVLSSVPPIVENIFKHLKLRDLNSCSAVCRLWKKLAEIEKDNREDVYWFFKGLKCSVHNEVHYARKACAGRKYESMEKELSALFKDLRLRPKFCLLFLTEGLINEFSRFFPSCVSLFPDSLKTSNEEAQKTPLKNAIEVAVSQYLPKECSFLFTVSPGVIGCHSDCEPMEVEDGFAISGLMIPDIPGLEIYNYTVDRNQFFWKIFELVPNNISIKCLLIFQTGSNSSCDSMTRQCLERENFNLALAGAFVDQTEASLGSVVAFCGESVEAASVVIKGSEENFEIKKKLESFQKTDLLNGRCFAFIFVSAYRGYLRKRYHQFESSIFHELYPTVPVVGVFGRGRIGVEYIPGISDSCDIPSKRKVPRSHNFSLSGASVFVLVSVKM